MALLKSIATVGGWTMMSRVLGFVRDLSIAHILGAGMLADAFFMAFKFPNLFRRLFAEGAMNAAFVPLFARRLEEDGPDAARRFGGEVAAMLVTFMMLFTVVAMAAMPWIMSVVARGFLENPVKFHLTVSLAQITFPYLMFMVVSAQFSGMLNSVGRFAAAAAAPVLLNLILIAVLLMAHFGLVEMPARALSLGVTIAGAAQFLFLANACRKAGILIRLPRPRMTPGVKRFLLLMAPGVVGSGVVQINVLVGDFLATHLGDGAVSYLYYADRVNQLPLGVVGIAVGVALLPLLTRQLRAGEEAAAMNSFNRALEVSLLLTLPAAAALAVMPWPIVSVLFERGAFDATAARATADALQVFALGLPAYVLIKALSPGFFAREDTATPVKIAAFTVALNIILATLLMRVMAHVGIALATTITAWINVAVLAFVLHRRGHFAMDARLAGRLPRLLLSVAVMGGALWFAVQLLLPALSGPLLVRIGALALLVAGGAALFFVTAQITGGADLREVKSMLRRKPRNA